MNSDFRRSRIPFSDNKDKELINKCEKPVSDKADEKDIESISSSKNTERQNTPMVK